jgi:hypothetical protein
MIYISLEKNSEDISMKIKSLFILGIIFSCFISFAETKDCSSTNTNCTYLNTSGKDSFIDDSPGSFAKCYNIYLCEEFDPITKEAVKYVQAIKKTKWKTVREVVTNIGNIFCRWAFGSCGEKAFYDQYMTACATAKSKAEKSAAQNGKPVKTNSALYLESDSTCKDLANNLLGAFKDVSNQEAARYNGKLIEASSKKYLEPSNTLMQNLSNTMGTLIKKIGAVARSFEGFIKNVYNSWYTVGR